MQVVLPGFNVRLICFVQEKTLCKYDCMYFFCCTRAWVCRFDDDVICVCHDMNKVHWVVVKSEV